MSFFLISSRGSVHWALSTWWSVYVSISISVYSYAYTHPLSMLKLSIYYSIPVITHIQVSFLVLFYFVSFCLVLFCFIPAHPCEKDMTSERIGIFPKDTSLYLDCNSGHILDSKQFYTDFCIVPKCVYFSLYLSILLIVLLEKKMTWQRFNENLCSPFIFLKVKILVSII